MKLDPSRQDFLKDEARTEGLLKKPGASATELRVIPGDCFVAAFAYDELRSSQ